MRNLKNLLIGMPYIFIVKKDKAVVLLNEIDKSKHAEHLYHFKSLLSGGGYSITYNDSKIICAI